MSYIYLDNHTTTRPSLQAIEAMLPFLHERWFSPYAPYNLAQELVKPIQKYYGTIYDLVGASKHDFILLTSSNAEAINHLVWSTYMDVTRENGKNQFITSNIEEAATILSMSRMEQLGCISSLASVDANGYITAEAIAGVLTPRAALLSLSWANGMTGVIHPVEEIGQLCKERGILFHLDASYVLGKIAFDLEETGADFISFNGNFIHAPSGMGALCLRQGIELTPFIIGGPEQASTRGGEFNVGALAALACAAKQAMDESDLMGTEIARLRDKFERALQTQLHDTLALFTQSQRLPNCAVIAFAGVSSEALLYHSSQHGLCASFGGGSHQNLNLILSAAGIEPTHAQSALHFSLSRNTTEEQIDSAVELIVQCVQNLRKLSNKIL